MSEFPISDLQLPDEPNRGFSIARETGDGLQSTQRLFTEAFPLGQQLPDNPLVIESLREQFAQSGGVLYRSRDVAQYSEIVSVARVTLEVDLSESEFGAISAIMAKKGLSQSPDAVIDALVNGDEDIEQVLHEPVARASLHAINELDEIDSRLLNTALRKAGTVGFLQDLDEREVAELQQVCEIFELESGGSVVHLANFSSKQLSEEQLRQIVNAFRGAEDVSGGRTPDLLDAIIIVPANHPAMYEEFDDGKGGVVIKRSAAITRNRTIIVSDEMILPAEEVQLPEGLMATDGYDDSEYSDLPFTVASHPAYEGHHLEINVAHELAHVLLMHRPFVEPDKTTIEGVASLQAAGKYSHTTYGRDHPEEGLAETLAGLFAGGEAANAIETEYIKLALSELERIHGKRREGPQFVRCRDVGLDDPSRFAPRLSNRALPPVVTNKIILTIHDSG